MSDKLKKLTGKNPKDYEPIVYSLVNDCDIELFKELVEADDFLFDFVKNNVADRIQSVVNEDNYLNLLQFLKYYSPYYEDIIVKSLVKYANEELTDNMLEIFENGSNAEKAYCAKYFGYIKDPLAREYLVKNSYSENDYVVQNCAITLAIWEDREVYDDAISKLKDDDDFEKLAAVKFLVAYGDKQAIPFILKSLKVSGLAENIAGEIPYLQNLFELLDNYYEDALFVINAIINGIGEILPFECIFDFELFEVFERLLANCDESKCAVVLLNASEKFDIFTENDEYLFDEDKNTKNEIYDIKKLLKSADKKELYKFVNYELNENSPFVYTALDFASDVFVIRELLKSNNQTLILKTAEVLKKLDNFDETARTVALLKVTDINIKSIIRAL